MMGTLQKQINQSPQLSSKLSFARCKMEKLSLGRKNGYMSYRSPRSRQPACTCSNRPGSVRCSRHGYVVPEKRLKRHPAYGEILRRALTPPPRRLALRWLNFRPRPSRLSVMSMA